MTVKVEFQLLVESKGLGLTYDDVFLRVRTNPFVLKAPLVLSNTALSMETSFIIDSKGNILEIQGEEIEHLPFDEMDELMSRILQTGRLPDGTYRIELVVYDENDNVLNSASDVLVASHPVALELITPGGFLEDTTNTAITTTYPFFQWESDPCAICTYFIRVAQFKPDEHSTMEDAIEDLTVLPLDQAAGFIEVGNVTSYQYPTAGAADLEPGRVYVWQVQKAIPTTERDEFVNSFIYAFKILDPTATPTTGAGDIQDPILQFLQSVMGTDQFDITFSAGGDLVGFTPTNTIILNGEPGDLNDLSSLTTAVDQGEASIISVEVQ